MLGGKRKGRSAQFVAAFRHAAMKLVYIRQCVSVSNVKKMHSNDIFAEVHVADVRGGLPWGYGIVSCTGYLS